VSEKLQAAGGRLEFQRQNLWVGLFVVAAMAAFTAVALVAVQERVFRKEYRLNSSFARIEGLKSGAEVFLRGYAVGRVTRIGLTTTPDVRFDVEFTVEEAVRLPAGSRVRLSTRGFGSKVLDIVTPGDPTDPEAPPMPAAGRPAVFLADGATLPGSAGSDLDALLSDVVVLTRRVSNTLQRVDTLIADSLGPQIESTMATVSRDLDALVADLGTTMKDARGAMAQVETVLGENRPKIARLMDLADEDLRTAGDLGRRVDTVIQTIQLRLAPLVDGLESTLQQADGLIGQAGRSIKEEDLKEIVTNLKTLSEKGNLLVEELQRRPWRLMRRVKGEKQELMEELKARRKAEAVDRSGP